MPHSASPGCPHRHRTEHVIAAECRDDLVGRIADQHVASLDGRRCGVLTDVEWFPAAAIAAVEGLRVWGASATLAGHLAAGHATRISSWLASRVIVSLPASADELQGTPIKARI